MKIFFSFILLFCLLAKPACADKPKELAVKTFNGEEFNLRNLRGKIVVVNFWAYWCPNCVRAMVEFEKLYQTCPNFEMIGVSVDPAKVREKVLARAEKVSYRNALFADATENNFPEIEFIPTTFIIDRDGVAREINGVPKCSQLK